MVYTSHIVELRAAEVKMEVQIKASGSWWWHRIPFYQPSPWLDMDPKGLYNCSILAFRAEFTLGVLKGSSF